MFGRLCFPLTLRGHVQRGRIVGVALAYGAALLAATRSAGAQRAGDEPLVRRVSGRVVRGTRAAQVPVRNAWVVLHRVGSDRAGPLDSVRTAANGGYAFQYRLSGDSSAIYFAAASHAGIAYFTPPFRAPVVAGDDAQITVFDTTTGPIRIDVAGRHLIVGSAQPNGRRTIGEVYELQNDTTVTLIARDTVPLWTAHIPAGATGFALNRSGDVSPAAVRQQGVVVGLFAPLSPGVRQFAFTYELPSAAFPLRIPIDRSTGVLEVLAQEPSARVDGADLHEIAPASAEGRTFRRFQSQNVVANAVVTIDIPQVASNGRLMVIAAVAGAMVLVMIVAFGVVARRHPTFAPVAGARGETPSEALIRAIAALDGEFERSATSEVVARDAYATRRTALKAQLAATLAAGRRAR